MHRLRVKIVKRIFNSSAYRPADSLVLQTPNREPARLVEKMGPVHFWTGIAQVAAPSVLITTTKRTPPESAIAQTAERTTGSAPVASGQGHKTTCAKLRVIL